MKSLVYVRSDQEPEITSKLEQTTNFVCTKQWNKYVEFQGVYQDRLNILRSEKREIPKEAGAERNMQPIPHTWTGGINKTQPAKHFENNASCAFDDKSIRDYERHNKKFEESI